jgi:predicted dehydrogenase
MSETVTIVGVSKMGIFAAECWQSRGKEVVFIDKDPQKETVAKEYNARFLSTDNPRHQDYLHGESDIVYIATSIQAHETYVRTALKAGVPKILLEKPSLQSTQTARQLAEDFPDALVGVDYIERASPAVQAIKDDMKANKFVPGYFLNWRSRDVRQEAKENGHSEVPDSYKPFTIRDLTHDISMVDLFLEELQSIGAKDGSIIQSRMSSWRGVHGTEYPWEADAISRFRVLFPNQVLAYFYGEGDFNYKRSFLASDEFGLRAYFGQTLIRKNREPFALVAESPAAVDRLYTLTNGGDLMTPDFLLHQLAPDARLLDLSKYNPNALDFIIENLEDAKVPDDLICPLKKAVEIEELAVRAYEFAGKSNYLNYA